MFLKLIEKLFQGLLDLFIDEPQIDRAKMPTFHMPKTSKSKKFVNKWWRSVFYNKRNIKYIADKSEVYTKKGYGLIYFYNINGLTRYVGQTRESALRWRISKRQKGGIVGYCWEIKIRMLNAYKNNQLSIKTIKMPTNQLNKAEKDYIQKLAPYNRLWNKEFNLHFKHHNYFN